MPPLDAGDWWAVEEPPWPEPPDLEAPAFWFELGDGPGPDDRPKRVKRARPATAIIRAKWWRPKKRIRAPSLGDPGWLIVGLDTEYKQRVDNNSLVSFQLSALGRSVVVRSDNRPELARVLGEFITLLLNEGLISRWPKAIVLSCHWTRADIVMFSDWCAIRDRVDAVSKTYATLNEPLYLSATDKNRNRRNITVMLFDTRLYVGPSTSLKMMGDDLGLKKIELPPGAIERMDEFADEDPELFEAYAARDPEISCKFTEMIIQFCLDLGIRKLPPTAGSLAVNHLLKQVGRKRMVNLRGMKYVQTEIWKDGKPQTKDTPEKVDEPSWVLAKCCYHGGHNGVYHFGPTPPGMRFYEHDLEKAYLTAMLLYGEPDWARKKDNPTLTDVGPTTLGFLEVSFQFNNDVRHPCLPVAGSKNRGLVFPKSGVSYAGAPEVHAAMQLGAEIEIIRGFVVPWANENKPLAKALRVIQANAKAAKDAGNDMLAEMWKLLGNSLYGKFAQGLREKKVLDIRTGRRVRIPESKITSPYVAAFITSYIRAVMAEIINEPGQRVISVTTDSLITNRPLNGLVLNGPMCATYKQARESIGQPPTVLGTKAEVEQLYVWRCRGIATLKEGANPNPKIANVKIVRAGISGKYNNDQIVAWIRSYKPGDKYEASQPISFTTQHEKRMDLVFEKRQKTLDFTPDLRAWPINARLEKAWSDGECVDLLAFNTEPYDTIEKFESERDLFDRWSRDHTLRTLEDWRSWEQYKAGSIASKDGRVNRRGGRIQQMRRIWIRGALHAFPHMSYEGMALTFTEAGLSTSVQQVKDEKRAMRRLSRRAQQEGMCVKDNINGLEGMRGVPPEGQKPTQNRNLRTLAPAANPQKTSKVENCGTKGLVRQNSTSTREVGGTPPPGRRLMGIANRRI